MKNHSIISVSYKRVYNPAGLGKLALPRPVRFLLRKHTQSAARGYLYVQGGWISASLMRQSVIPKIHRQRYSYKIQSRGLSVIYLFIYFLTNIWTQKVLSWPDSSLKCQTFNKRTAVLYRKVFFISLPFFLPR